MVAGTFFSTSKRTNNNVNNINNKNSGKAYVGIKRVTEIERRDRKKGLLTYGFSLTTKNIK